MTSQFPGPGRRTRLRGRERERAQLDDLTATIRRGESRSLVLRGEAGIGKTALLEHLVAGAADLTVVRAVGVESEMELAYASLHQLCAPLLGRLDGLPAPQRQALEIVFGLSAGNAPDRFLVGLAVLSLFAAVAEERPLLCVVDDTQWLDQASELTLAFVARRLLAEPVGIVFATREPGEGLQHLPQLEVGGVGDDDARALLGATATVKLDEAVRDRVVAEMRGNPLALLELPRGLSAAQLAGGFGLTGGQALTGRIEESFVRRLELLSADGRLLLLIAAAEPVGDPLLLWGAAERLGIGPAAAQAAEAEGLLAIGGRVTFRHPLVRSAMYRTATAGARRAVHLALAAATDRAADPDRRAWHLAAAAERPDEEVAVELERSAGRAQARGGLAAASAFLQRAVALTKDPARRAERALAAAQASLQAGAFDAALGLAATAQAGALDEFQRARADLLRAQVAFISFRGGDAPALLLEAARRLEPFDLERARDTYLTAWGASLVAAPAAGEGVLLEICRAVRALPALLSDGGDADDLYREAIDRLGLTRLRPELARAHLLYGEWLRRQNRRVDAREQLRAAHELLAAIGMEAFAARARRELAATGENVRKRAMDARDDLTAQERHIAGLARDGLANPEIGARLFLSPRTVEWHLGNVFTKLGIRSRRDLATALAVPTSS